MICRGKHDRRRFALACSLNAQAVIVHVEKGIPLGAMDVDHETAGRNIVRCDETDRPGPKAHQNRSHILDFRFGFQTVDISGQFLRVPKQIEQIVDLMNADLHQAATGNFGGIGAPGARLQLQAIVI
jgi:hypothetical protein